MTYEDPKQEAERYAAEVSPKWGPFSEPMPEEDFDFAIRQAVTHGARWARTEVHAPVPERVALLARIASEQVAASYMTFNVDNYPVRESQKGWSAAMDEAATILEAAYRHEGLEP